MACGLIPVVSDAVGCGPDLVAGIGEVFPVGDVGALADALGRVARDAPARRARLRDRLAGFTIAATAAGYEQAAIALGAAAVTTVMTPTQSAGRRTGRRRPARAGPWPGIPASSVAQSDRPAR